MSEVFFPVSPEFVKKHAKQVKKAFPGLALSVAHEATARALGFSSLFDCTARLTGDVRPMPSKPDEEVDAQTRLLRRYKQIRALTDFAGLPAFEVDEFVRRWSLTASAPSTLARFSSTFAYMDADIREMECGRITEDELAARYDFDDAPRRVADGIVVGLVGVKHHYYVLNSERIMAMPVFLRGNSSIFLEWEIGAVVRTVFPEAFSRKDRDNGMKYLSNNENWVYEWLTGHKSPDFHGVTLMEMAATAKQAPEEWFALSIRYEISGNQMLLRQPVFPALRGRDFVRFIENKGSLNGLELQWFKQKKNDGDDIAGSLFSLRFGHWEPDGNKNANKLPADLITPCMPLYGSPFKHGPMCEIEFSNAEGGGMMLADELEDDDEEDVQHDEA